MGGVALFVNGTVLTMDPARPVAGALAVRGRRIAAVGSAEEVHRLREPASTVVDLEGKTVLPGFVDAHNYFSTAALHVFWADCSTSPLGSTAEIQAALEAYTINAARAGGLERECGSLESGKRADLIVLDRNPLEVSPEELPRLKVLKMLVAGEEVWP